MRKEVTHLQLKFHEKGDPLGYLVPAIVDLIYNLFCFM
jgi:hypothetical protein